MTQTPPEPCDWYIYTAGTVDRGHGTLDGIVEDTHRCGSAVIAVARVKHACWLWYALRGGEILGGAYSRTRRDALSDARIAFPSVG